MYGTGWRHPLLGKSAGHKIAFCSHCHLLVASRSVHVSRRDTEPETTGAGPRSRHELAKPLRWFPLKLAAPPVGFINSQLAQTLTGMRELFPPGQRSPLCLLPHFPPSAVSSASPLGEKEALQARRRRERHHAAPLMESSKSSASQTHAVSLAKMRCGSSSSTSCCDVIGAAGVVVLTHNTAVARRQRHNLNMKENRNTLRWICCRVAHMERVSPDERRGLTHEQRGHETTRLLSWSSSLLRPRYRVYDAFKVILLRAPASPFVFIVMQKQRSGKWFIQKSTR